MTEHDDIYLDYNATTPIAPEAVEAMRPALSGLFGNPSSTHRFGREARAAVEAARGSVAALLGCHDDEVVFTSGGTEANNMALVGVARACRGRGRHIITSAVEHPAVSEVCAALEAEGFDVTTLDVDRSGMVDPADLQEALTDDTILVTVMHANNEVGTIMPLAEIARLAHERGALVHSDGAQAAGKIAARVDRLGVDLYSVAGHKLYAPKGVGALFIKRGTPLSRFMSGANHEANRRPGTENVLEIIGLGAAAELARGALDDHAAHLKATRDRLQEALLQGAAGLALVHGRQAPRLPNTLSVAFPGLQAGQLLEALPHLAASAGAACHSEGVTLSHVLVAMGVPDEVALGTLRLSTGRETTFEQVDRAAAMILEAVTRLRAER